MSYVGFRYCPFCGEEMPQNNMMKFCPFCGEKYPPLDKENLDIIRDTVTLQIPLMNNNIENERRHEIYITNKQLQEVMDFEYYSIILKHAVDTSILIENLEKVLLRSVFAIRLAIDNMPSLIIYKAKGADIAALHKIFIESQASISIVPGEYNNKPSVEEFFPMFYTLNVQMQENIRSMPINLWMGDSIKGIFSIKYGESKDGLLVISNRNIYILYKYALSTEFRWLAISYTLLLKVVEDINSLQFIYKNKKVERVDFLNHLELVEAFKTISHIVMI